MEFLGAGGKTRALMDRSLAALDCCFDELAGNLRLRFAARPQAIPENDGDQGKHEDDGGNRINFGCNAAAQPSPNFEWQSVVAAGQKKSDRDLVHGEGEN